MSCVNRVWDNGDMDSCGKTTAPDNKYCKGCRTRLLLHHREETVRLRIKLTEHRAARRELLQEAKRSKVTP